jgi:hypothetical protein
MLRFRQRGVNKSHRPVSFRRDLCCIRLNSEWRNGALQVFADAARNFFAVSVPPFKRNHRLYGRLFYNYNYIAQAAGNVPGFLAGIDYRNRNLVVSDTYMISPSALNVASFTLADIDRVQVPVVPKNLTWKDLGANFTRATEGSYPAAHDTNVQGYFNAFSRYVLFRNQFTGTPGR